LPEAEVDGMIPKLGSSGFLAQEMINKIRPAKRTCEKNLRKEPAKRNFLSHVYPPF